MIRLLSYLSLSCLFTFISISVNAEINNGKELHDSNCTSCHISMQGGDGSSIYTRENNRIHSYAALITQVNRCRDSLGIPWPEEHITDVADYLNTAFYKFKK